jgi:uncharacterized protein YgiM (DUF1202 family)
MKHITLFIFFLYISFNVLSQRTTVINNNIIFVSPDPPIYTPPVNYNYDYEREAQRIVDETMRNYTPPKKLEIDFNDSYNPYYSSFLPAYITVTIANVRMDPFKESAVIKKLEKGEEVKVESSIGDWWKVCYLEFNFTLRKMSYGEGWIYRKSLKPK